MQITLKGGASAKTENFTVTNEELDLSLLSFLQARDIPIASSCRGVGSCTLCCFNETELACQVKIKDCINKEIKFDYL